MQHIKNKIVHMDFLSGKPEAVLTSQKIEISHKMTEFSQFSDVFSGFLSEVSLWHIDGLGSLLDKTWPIFYWEHVWAAK